MKAFFENRSYHTNLQVSIFKVTDFNFLAHWHNDIEIIYLYTGKLRVGINNESKIIHAGELAIASSGDIHYYDSNGLESTGIVLIFKPSFLGFPDVWPENNSVIFPFIDMSLQTKSNVPSNINQLFQQIFQNLFLEMDNEIPHYNLFIQGEIFKLCGIFMRYFSNCNKDIKKDYRKFPVIKNMQVALEYIESNYSEDLTLEAVAKKANLSVFYFSRLFKDISGMSFKTYLNTVRINNAEHLINTTTMPMVDIAFDCGFNSVRTFNRVYKTINGCTPSSLRLN